jgi:hypothetical protein
MFYLDSSAAVSSITAEPATATVLDWLAGRTDVLISDWTLAEAVAGLSLKRRRQVLSAEEHVQTLEALRNQVGESFRVLPVTRQDFRKAANFCERPETGLRAADALHLAIAVSAGATLVTLDKVQARGGEMVGVRALLLP